MKRVFGLASSRTSGFISLWKTRSYNLLLHKNVCPDLIPLQFQNMLSVFLV